MTTKKKSGIIASNASVAALPAARNNAPLTDQPPTLQQQQLTTFDAAVRLFTQQKFSDACQLFEQAAKGPAAHIADKARSYLQICERKVAGPALDFQTAEDHFNYGVERLNARDFEQARLQLGSAIALEPDGDHLFYTLALCCGLSGDGNGACENLKRAIELEPRNRILARQDPEFLALAAHSPALKALLST